MINKLRGCFIAIAILSLVVAFSYAETSNFFPIPGHDVAKPAGLMPAMSTVWLEDKPEVPLVALFADSLKEIAWRSGQAIENYPFIYAAYNDGTAIFSKDISVGGPPYYSTTIVEAALVDLKDVVRQIQDTANINTPYGAGGYGHTAVIVQNGKLTKVKSTHVFVEAAGKYLATCDGYIAADGQCFAGIAASQPAHFVEYRQCWDQLFQLQSIFDQPETILLGNLQCDSVFASPEGVFEVPADFFERRERRARFAADGDTMRIDEIRQKYADISPVYPPPNCE